MGSLWWVWQTQGICYFLQKRHLNKSFEKLWFRSSRTVALKLVGLTDPSARSRNPWHLNASANDDGTCRHHSPCPHLTGNHRLGLGAPPSQALLSHLPTWLWNQKPAWLRRACVERERERAQKQGKHRRQRDGRQGLSHIENTAGHCWAYFERSIKKVS